MSAKSRFEHEGLEELFVKLDLIYIYNITLMSAKSRFEHEGLEELFVKLDLIYITSH